MRSKDDMRRQYLFIGHHQYHPIRHPELEGVQDKPEIIATDCPLSEFPKVVVNDSGDRQVPYPRVVSYIACKPQYDDGNNLVADYLLELLEARPDMPGVYGLWARPQHYQVLWSDASGVVTSPMFDWDNLEPLASYVLSLYDPPKSHYLRDPTISLSPREPVDHQTVWWIIQGLSGSPDLVCKRIFVGNQWGRRTSIYLYVDCHGKIVIKDSYCDDKHRFKEENLLRHIHKDGTFPGVVRLLPITCKIDTLTTAQRVSTGEGEDLVLSEPERTKTRLLLGSYGRRLKDARSVMDILMAFYDINEGATSLLLF